MLVVGLTGSIGSGKSTVADLFAEKDVPVIDADIIARQVTQAGSPAHDAIVEHFGKKLLMPDGGLDRRQLREIVFNSPTDREWLEKLLHPLILEQMADEISQLNTPYCIAVIPLLLESNSDSFIQRILVVDVPEEVQLQRAALRDNSSVENIKSILKTQAAREKRLAHANDVIDNSGTLEALHEQVENLHQKYLKLGKRK